MLLVVQELLHFRSSSSVLVGFVLPNFQFSVMFLAIVCHSVYDFLVTPLVSSYFWPLFSLWVTDSSDTLDIFMLFAIVCPSVYNFWLPLWHLHIFGHCLPFALRLLVTPLISSCFFPLSALRFTTSGDPLGIIIFLVIVCPVYSFRYSCGIFLFLAIVCLSVYDFWLLLWDLRAFDHCLSFKLRLLVTICCLHSFLEMNKLISSTNLCL